MFQSVSNSIFTLGVRTLKTKGTIIRVRKTPTYSANLDVRNMDKDATKGATILKATTVTATSYKSKVKVGLVWLLV
jgi:hypothetical protein